MDTKKCNMCGEEKEMKEHFHLNKASSTGYSNRCKLCSSITSKKYRNEQKGGTSPLKLSQDPKTKIPAEEILTALGYELYNEENPVHEQFNERIYTKYGFK